MALKDNHMIQVKPGMWGFTKIFEQKFSVNDERREYHNKDKNKRFIVMMLGTCNDKKHMPTQDDIATILVNTGLVSFDWVSEYFGKEETEKFIERINKNEIPKKTSSN